MTDPKTAARAVATRLAESEISIKHVQALDLVAAGCGFQDRSKLTDLAELPVLKRVNARLLASAATVLARHDLTRRTKIVDATTAVLIPKTFDVRTVRSRGDRIGDDASKGVVPFMKAHMDAVASVLQGGTYREGYAHYAPIHDEAVMKYVSDRPGISAFLNEASDEGPWVIVSNPDGQPSDPWTVFWSEDDLWGGFADATLYMDRRSPLPKTEDRSRATVRWMSVEDAAFRAAVDMAVVTMDRDEPDVTADPDVPGDRMLDYERISAMIDLSNVFDRRMGPIEIAVRDAAQRTSLYTSSLSEDPGTRGGQVKEWVRDVKAAFADGAVPSGDQLRALLMEGDAAISNIRDWIETDDRLWAWLNVAAYPDAIDNAIDAEGSGVTEGIDMKPLQQMLSGMKTHQRPSRDDKAAWTASALLQTSGVYEEPRRQGKGFMAPCPAHDDAHPSLIVTNDGRGGVAFKCLTGCDADAVEKAVERELMKITGNAPTDAAHTLDERRRLMAQARFEAHAFGQDVVVAESDGWEWTTPGEEWSRTVYLESSDDDDDDENEDDVTESATYVVKFAPGLDKVVSSYAISGNGTMIGTTVDPDHAGVLDIGEGLTIPIAVVTGEICLESCAEAKAIIDEVVEGVYFSTWSPVADLSKSSATEIASLAIEGLRKAKTPEERDDARRAAVASVLPPQEASEACWSEVRSNAQTIIDAIDGAMDDLDERIDYDKDELEQEIMNLAFARLEAEDTSTWRETFQGSNAVELYLHMLPKGDSVEETCTIDHPHVRPENVVVDDQFRFVLSRLGITPTEWKAFARPKTVEKVVSKAPTKRGEPLVSPEELGVLIENGAPQNFLVSLYCQAPLMDVLDLDMTKPIAFERCSVSVLNVMVGTFMDKRMKDVIEFKDGFDGLLTTSDCGPYASQTDDLVASAYFSRVGTADAVSRGPAATAELDSCLAVEGLRRTAPGDRVAWRDEGKAATGPIVLKADVSCQDASHTYGLRTIVAVFDDAKATRPEIEIGRRW